MGRLGALGAKAATDEYVMGPPRRRAALAATVMRPLVIGGLVG
jgi:hypothetical protein